MGNSFSVLPDDQNSSSDIKKKIDDIAMNYILTQNSLDLIRFTDKEYYDNVVILTANILKSNLNNVELGILNDRVQFGENINGNNKLFIKSANQMKDLTIKNDKVKEKVLEYVSKFYVKVMTIFSAIVATIDPKYINEGDGQIFSLKDFDDYKYIDGESNSIKLYSLMNPMGLIMKRLNILKNKMGQTNEDGQPSEYVTINPGEKFCKMNQITAEEGGYGGKMTLQNEIGIKELDRLYYDIYDYDEKAWTKKSEKMEESYERDLDKFYTIFTGNEERPDYVNSFKDIELLEYHKLARCRNEEFFKDIILSRDDPLLVKYTKKIDEIHNMVYKKKQELLFVLKSLFLVQEKTTEDGVETKTILNPDLNLEGLKKSQEKVKDIILEMYTHCEYCFIQALLIYELIYTDKYGELSEEEMNNISGENSDIKPDIRQLIGDASIMNASKNMLPDPSEGMNNNGIEPANTGNTMEQQPNEVSPLNNEMREIESGNTSMNSAAMTNQPQMAEGDQLENGVMVQPQNEELNINAQPNPVGEQQPVMEQQPVGEQQPVMEQNSQMNGENTVENANKPSIENGVNSNKSKLLSFSNKPTPQFILNKNVNNANMNRNTNSTPVPVAEQPAPEQPVENNGVIGYSNNMDGNSPNNAQEPEQENNGAEIANAPPQNAQPNENKSFIQKITGFFSKKPENNAQNESINENMMENANMNNGENMEVQNYEQPQEPEQVVNVEQPVENVNAPGIPTNSLPEPSVSDIRDAPTPTNNQPIVPNVNGNRNNVNAQPEKSANNEEESTPGFIY